jgi:hypothetical protein
MTRATTTTVVLVALLILAGPLGAAELTFTPHVLTGAFPGTMSACIGDIDGDGDQDAAGVSFDGNQVSWFRNDGTLDFVEVPITNTYVNGRTVVAADNDGDGADELLTTTMAASRIDWWDRQEDGTFTMSTVYAGPGQPHTAVAVDLDGDLDLDVLAALWSDKGFVWFENDGVGGYVEHAINVMFPATCIMAVDLDGDGDLDLVGTRFTAGYGLIWWENDGAQTFTLLLLEFPFAHWADAADFDGDGDIDLLSGSCGSAVSWWENDGNQEFTERIIISSPSFHCVTSVFATDLDRDGDMDVLAAAEQERDASWFENDGHGSFTKHVIDAAARGSSGIVAGDVDGDDASEVLVAARFSNRITLFETINPATGVLDPAVEPSRLGVRALPNPFRDQTVLAYRLDRAGHVRLAVYDVAGRLVAEPAAGWQEPGDQQAIWNGDAGDGRRVAPGVYLLRVTVDGGDLGTRRVVVLN